MSDLRGLARFFLCVQAIPNICLIYRRFPAISAFLRLPGPKNRLRPGFPFFLQTHIPCAHLSRAPVSGAPLRPSETRDDFVSAFDFSHTRASDASVMHIISCKETSRASCKSCWLPEKIFKKGEYQVVHNSTASSYSGRFGYLFLTHATGNTISSIEDPSRRKAKPA